MNLFIAEYIAVSKCYYLHQKQWTKTKRETIDINYFTDSTKITIKKCLFTYNQ